MSSRLHIENPEAMYSVMKRRQQDEPAQTRPHAQEALRLCQQWRLSLALESLEFAELPQASLGIYFELKFEVVPTTISSMSKGSHLLHRPTLLQRLQSLLMFCLWFLVVWAVCYLFFPAVMQSSSDSVADGFDNPGKPPHKLHSDDPGYPGTPWSRKNPA